MKRKFFNAKIYRNDAATELIVKNGKIIRIGSDLPKCAEEIDLRCSLIQTVMPNMIRVPQGTSFRFHLAMDTLVLS